MASETLTELLAPPDEDSIRQQLLSDLNAVGFPITDWESGAVMRTFIELLTRGYLELVGRLIPQITAGGFITEADATWLRTLVAPQFYNLIPQAATFTIQQATLTCDADNGPYTITAGQLIAKTTAGRRYTNITGGSLATSGTLDLKWQSEGPNDSTSPASNYNDGAGTMTELVTPMLGVSINNPPIDFTPVTLAGVGPSKVLTAARTDSGTAPAAGTVLVKITDQGQVGEAKFKYRRIGAILDNDYVAGGLASSVVGIPGTNMTLSFVNDVTANPTFIAGDLFAVSSPGGPIIQQGRDQETPAALIARCQDRWPALSDIPTRGKYRLWAFEADRQVTKAGVVPDPSVPNQVLVTIGGQVNPLVGSVIANVQKFIDARLGITETTIVTTATIHVVNIQGYITVPVGQTAAIQAVADQAWQDYIAGLDVGGTAKISELQRILGDAVKAVAGEGASYDLLSLRFANPNAGIPPLGTLVNVQAASNEVLQIATGDDGRTRVPSVALAWYEA